MSYYVLEKALGDHDHGSKAFNRPEVLVFKSDKDGNVTDWVECFGEKHEEDTTINEAIHSTMVRFNRLDK
jgi:hypothetical protein